MIPHSQLAQPTAAYDKANNAPPKWTMRAREVFGDQMLLQKKQTGGEPSKDLRNEVEATKNSAPSWSMLSRSGGIPKPLGYPGPGEYPIPSTVQQTHPVMGFWEGRGWNFGAGSSARTRSAGSVSHRTPGPHEYTVRTGDKIGTLTHKTLPHYSMGTKLNDPSNKEKRPGPPEYSIGKQSRFGEMVAPNWSFLGRGSSSCSKLEKSPGPGSHKPRNDVRADMKRAPSYSWGSCPRFPNAKADNRPF